MAVTVTDNATIIDNMENINNVSPIGGSSEAEDAIHCQGTFSVGVRVNSTGVQGLAVDSSGVSNNMTNRILMIWGFTMQAVDTLANGGWRIRVSSQTGANANYYEWDCAGGDTMASQNNGFQCFAAGVSETPTRTAGSAPNLSSVQGIALLGNLLTSNGRVSYFQDQAKHMTQTYIRGGTMVAPGLSSEIASNDRTNARGTFQFVAGAYFLLGEIQFGTTAAATDTHFHDEGIDWIFQDMPVGPLNGLSFVGGTGTNMFSLGAKVGTGVTAVGVNGGLIHKATATAPRFFIDALEADIDTQFYGVSVSGAAKVRFEGGSNVEVLSSTFVDCDTVSIRNGAILRGGSVITNSFATTAGALDLGDTNPPVDSVRDIQVNNSSRGILLQGASTGTTNFDFRNITFNGNTFDVRVDFPAGATININILEGGDAPTVENVNGSTVNINSSVNFVLDNVVAGSTIYVEATAGGPLGAGTPIIGPLTEATTTHTSALNFSGDQPFRATVSKATGSPFYAPETFSGTITNSGFTRRLSQQLDQ